VQKALLLDRDGVINIDNGYVGKIEKFQFVDGILPLIRLAEEKGYLPIIVTNQSGIGRGYYSVDDFEKLTEWMIEKMRKNGIAMNRSQVFFCPHLPEEGCDCRKPRPGMILEATKRFKLDLPNSWMIGDKISDIEAAYRAGVGHMLLTRSNRPIDRKDLHGF
jgi:D-glycero-D-manno-heptose 1,7-bisphosphate phosphatase